MSSSENYLEVAVPLPIGQTFTYLLPAELQPGLSPGMRVLVPFGRRLLAALALERHDRGQEQELKTVRKVLDKEPLLSPQLLRLGRWISSYYFSPPGEAFRVMLPPGLLTRKSSRDVGTDRFWPSKRQLAVKRVVQTSADLTPRQLSLVEQLRQQKLPVLLSEFTRRAGCSVSTLRGLEARGIIEITAVDQMRSPWLDDGSIPSEAQPHSLNEDQLRIVGKVLQHLNNPRFHTMLIHGVTGSGKTEIYLNAISTALELGKSALMLVPEIGLTPQIARSFRTWFGEKVAILHSGLSDGERFDQWRRIRRGLSPVVVGTRSAVFAPVQKLGLIIVDEEHDASYKQDELPRYHGRDTALKRGQIEDCLVILASATPQLETYYQAAEKERYEFEEMSGRVMERPLPTVHIVDMRHEFQKHGRNAVISEILKDAIAQRLEKRQQVLILLNRRGYAASVLCRSCGATENCLNCSITLTHHLESNRLVCHYCGYSRSVPAGCRECGREYIHFLGEGTEKIQELLTEMFPDAPIARLDRDSVRRKGSAQRILAAFAAGRTRLLIGTQMIAKGHDFPGVTLVGVLAADQGLRMADFRAAERTFQLLTQVAGRAGRGEQPGDVILQTYFPNHYSLKYACDQDYRRFYDKEVQFRRNFRYPPFTALANLLLQGDDLTRVTQQAARLVELLNHSRKQYSSENRMRVLGPAAAPLERLRGEFRRQILIKTTNRIELHKVLKHSLDQLDAQERRAVTVDVDPVNLL